MHFLAMFFHPFFGFGFVFYFLPAILAFARNKRDSTAILVLNLLLGWTVIGWVIALVWSLRNDVPVAAR
ncbi:MAG TPA: superinfection immunity protein [Terriglobales bacterium]